MTKVIFKYHEKNSDLFAFFPDEVADSKGNKMSYQHVGQHGACSEAYADESRLATKEEYKDLLNELIYSVGYDDLEIMNKVKNIKELPVTLDELYEGKKQINVHLSDKNFIFDIVLLDNRQKIDCKISSFAGNIYTRTAKGMKYEKYKTIADLQREVKKSIKNKIDTNGEIMFTVSNQVFSI